ncbi:uncharacterized protein SPAPADRAFT_57722 [Spathaspora passalidarum NRRL Y-27907]|uniref:NADH:ubiquinone oxidoreductase intermediate-associated protein 30 domain-containing protein n=1 Tax=Spathaspora passalidarum (strain NRRL Y-27907 / 11-Y1) TaxID=619300 RepID=G3AGZ9_SPAPN|nr:uncharacterized protein SPAPADRAFT_57722 [Spathaspora passalidarum NRRL Y-27907]EGW34672.1 hypothetical protein SPAPADRAFT_57722 [Spathaspora passalidarum NRRL Y-27907]
MSLRTLSFTPSIKGLFQKPTDMVKSVCSVLDFKRNPESATRDIITRSDKELGGFSTVNFEIDPEEKVGHFHGYLSLDLPKDNPEIHRSGYAMFRTMELPESWFSGKQYWDWSQYSSLVMRVKGDRRKYLVNLQANTPLVTDLFQHRLFLNHPGQWETVVIPLDDFVMTNWGIIQDGSEINKSEIKTFGIGLLDKQYGPYSLKVDWVKVMTGAEVDKEAKKSRGSLSVCTPEQELKEEEEIEYEQTHPGSAMGGNAPKEPKLTLF